MKKLFTKSVKQIGFNVFKSLLPLLFLFILPVSNFAQLYPGTVDVGIFEAAAANTIEIRVKPTDATTYTMTNMQFTIKWADGSNNITPAFPGIYPYFIQAQGSPVLHNGYFYQIFATAGGFPMMWTTGGAEYVAATFEYSESCGEFEIADDNWTNANNGMYYIEILGFDATGVRYEPIVNTCASALFVDVYAMPDNVCVGDQVQLEAFGNGGSGTYTYSWVSDPAGFTVVGQFQNVNPLVTTTYTVTVDDGATTATNDVVVTVNPNPVADAGAAQNICEGDCATLYGSGGDFYLWSTGETDATISVCPAVTTTYTLTAIGGNGCSDTDEVIVTVFPTPNVYITGNTVVCEGECTTLTAHGGETYVWNTGETTESISICPTSSDTYSVTATDINGCTAVGTEFVDVMPPPLANAGPDVAICEGECSILTATGGSTYQWSTGNANSLFFSEYSEGSSNNKYLEIYNGTGADVVLSNYSILTNYNGNPWSGMHSFPTGAILAPGDVWVIANASADQLILDEADEIFSYGESGFVVNFNGDDVRALVRITGPDTLILDIIGRYDLIDPGDGWDVAGDADGTYNHTLVRKSTVCIGNPDWDMAAGTNASDSEWIVYPQNDWNYLGSHTGCPISGNTASITVCPTTTTTYTVTVTDFDGCTASDDVAVTVNPNPNANAGPDVTICDGACTTLSASGGGDFMWSTGETTGDINVCPTTTTTYTLVVTDLNGCTAFDEVEVTVSYAAYADAGPDVTICVGNCASLAANGNGSFKWDTGETTADITVCPTTTTTYFLVVTTTDGCTAMDDVIVTVSPGPNVYITGNTNVCEGECTTLTAYGGETYLWNTGETTEAISICPTSSGMYSVTATDINGCTAVAEEFVDLMPVPIANAGSDVAICEGGCTTLSASGGMFFMWSTGETTGDIYVCPTATTTYGLTVTNYEGCTATDDVVVTVNPTPTASISGNTILCEGDCTTLTASGSGTYFWSISAATASITVCPTATEMYYVTVTGTNGCYDVADITVTVNPNPIADAGTDQTITIGNSASLYATATGGTGSPYFYEWSTGDFSQLVSVMPTVTTTYTVTVTDELGCSGSDDVTITVTAPMPEIIITEIMYNPPEDYTDTLEFIEFYNKGTSAVDLDGFVITQGVVFTFPPHVLNPGDYVCVAARLNAFTNFYGKAAYEWTSGGLSNGGEDIELQDGLGNVVSYVDYDDSPPWPTEPDGHGPSLTFCDHNLVNNDGNNWTASTEFVGVVNGMDVYASPMEGCQLAPPVFVDAGADVAICEGESTNLNATVTGGVAPFTYSWTPAASLDDPAVANPVATPFATTTYVVVVTDNMGTTASDDVTVTVNPLPTASAGPDVAICEGDCTTLSASGGIMYVWNTGETVGDINVCPTATETYFVTVTDINGCQAGANVVVTVNPLPTASAGPDVAICDGDCTTLSASGGAMYVWSTGETMGDIYVCPTTTTTYWVTVTDINGCSNDAWVVVTVNPLPMASAGPDVTICDGDCTTLSASGGAMYVWSTGETMGDIYVCPAFTTIYTVTVTDINGCYAEANVTVTVNPSPQITLQPADQTVDVGDDAVFTVFALNATTYDWEVSTDGGLNWSNAGPPGATLTVSSVTLAMNGYLYRGIAHGPCPPSAVSNAASLTVLPIIPPAVVTYVGNDTVCDYGGIVVPIVVIKLEDVGAISITLDYDPSILVYSGFQNAHPALSIGNLTVNDTAGAVFVSWYTVGSVPINILFGTLVELTFTSPAGGCTDLTWDTITTGYCEYADPFGNILPSTYVDGSICVKTGPSIITNPIDVTVEEGQPATFNVTANNALTYTWEVSEDGGATWNYAGTGSMLTVAPTTIDMDGNQYRCVVTGECLPDAVSLSATLNVNPIITTTLGSGVTCAGDLIIPILVEHFYGVASLSYTFGYNTLGLNYVGIQNAHSELSTGTLYANEIPGGIIKISWASITPANIGDGTVLELVFSATNPSVTNLIWDLGTPGNCEYTNLASDYITSIWINGAITVYGLPIVYDVTGGGEYCDGGIGVDVGLSGSEAGVDYELLLDGNPTGNVIVGTGWAISFGNQLTAGVYTAFGLNGATFCTNDMNGDVTISINPNPVVDAGPDLSMLIGTSAFIDATVIGGTPGYTYMWAPDGQVTEDITVSPLVTTTYSLTGIDSKGCIATDDVLVTVYHNLISGNVVYDNAGTTIMNNVTVNLVDNGGTTVESTVTDATGYYAFGPHPNGTYTVEAESVKPWGGVNSTDALIVMEHFTGSLTLSGIKLIASDVNASGFTNAGDALRIAQRFAYVITSFVAGDWAFEENTIVLNEADVTNDFLALCFGDVNGSYTPPYVKVIPSVGLTNNGVIEVNDHTFEVPVTIDRDLELGAVSLIINYPAGLEIIDVKAKVEDLIYTSANGQLRISWFNTAAVNLNKDDALLTLTVKASTLEGTSFSLGNLSELADAYANVIEDASLNIPKLVEAGSILSGYSITNYPNPFNATTTIEYSIIEGANVTLTVFNLLGETVNVLVNEYQDEGIYLVEFDGSKLNSGLFYYKIETSNFVKTKTMVINK